MTGTEAAELDALRRRLYRPDASEDDRRAYERLRDRLAPAQPPPAEVDAPAPQRERPGGRTAAPPVDRGAEPAVERGAEPPVEPPATGRPRRSRIAVLVTAVLVAALAGSLALHAAQAPDADPTAAAPTAIAVPFRVAQPDPSQATPVAVSVEGVATTAQRFHGVGSAVVPLITGSAPLDGGRLIVVLTSDAPQPIGWRAARWSPSDDGDGRVQILARGPRIDRSGPGHPEASTYRGDPPADVEVLDSGAHRWTLTVTLLEPEARSALH